MEKEREEKKKSPAESNVSYLLMVSLTVSGSAFCAGAGGDFWKMVARQDRIDPWIRDLSYRIDCDRR